MEGVTAIRTVQEISVIRRETIVTPAVFTVEPQPALPPPPRKNKRVQNACALIGAYTLGLGGIILDTPNPTLPSSTNYGWNEEPNECVTKVPDLPPGPNIIVELVKCGCGTSRCSTEACSGAKHMKNCPAEPNLPAFVLAFGVIGMVARLLNCVRDWRSVYDDDESPTPRWLTFINLILLITSFILFIFVCKFTYSNLWPETRPEFASSKKYCHYELFTACWTGCGSVIMVYILPLCCRCC